MAIFARWCAGRFSFSAVTYISVAVFYFAEIDLNGMDNMGDDSDSVGNAPRTTRSAPGAGGGFTMPTKEKRKPFFKKVLF